MIRKIDDFKLSWERESQNTLRIFEKLTDESLSQAIPGGRTLGRLANHIIETLSELPSKVKLPVEEKPATNATVKELVKDYREKSDQVLKAVTENWTDASLEEEHNLYGEPWKNGFSLWVLITHQTHHRAQMTVLMRFAGLTVPGIYGPAREEWIAWGRTPLD